MASAALLLPQIGLTPFSPKLTSLLREIFGRDSVVEIRLWLRKVEHHHHHHAKNIPKCQWGDLAFSFLEQRPDNTSLSFLKYFLSAGVNASGRTICGSSRVADANLLLQLLYSHLYLLVELHRVESYVIGSRVWSVLTSWTCSP